MDARGPSSGQQQATTSGAALPGRERTRPVLGYTLAHEQFSPSQLLTYGAAAEQAGFEFITTSDHFQPWQPNQGHCGQAWVTLAALGQRTSRIVMGTAVTCPTFRYEPAIVAQAFASLSHLSPGRVFIGLGAGEQLNEGAAGGGWARYPERAERLVEAVQILRQLWSGRPVSFHGQYYRVEGRLYTPPAEPIPVYIAASGPKSARIAGEYGDGLIVYLEALQHQPEYLEAFREGAHAAGKNPDAMPLLAEHFLYVGSRQEAERAADLWRFLPKAWKPGYFNNISPSDIQQRAEHEIPREKVLDAWKVSDSADEHLEALQQLVDLGITHITIHSAQPDQERAIEFFGSQILPRIQRGELHTTREVVGV